MPGSRLVMVLSCPRPSRVVKTSASLHFDGLGRLQLCFFIQDSTLTRLSCSPTGPGSSSSYRYRYKSCPIFASLSPSPPLLSSRSFPDLSLLSPSSCFHSPYPSVHLPYTHTHSHSHSYTHATQLPTHTSHFTLSPLNLHLTTLSFFSFFLSSLSSPPFSVCLVLPVLVVLISKLEAL